MRFWAASGVFEFGFRVLKVQVLGFGRQRSLWFYDLVFQGLGV